MLVIKTNLNIIYNDSEDFSFIFSFVLLREKKSHSIGQADLKFIMQSKLSSVL